MTIKRLPAMVTLKIVGNQIAVSAPYHPAFPERARALGGLWVQQKWVFYPRDEERVRALCRDIFGDFEELP